MKNQLLDKIACHIGLFLKAICLIYFIGIVTYGKAQQDGFKGLLNKIDSINFKNKETKFVKIKERNKGKNVIGFVGRMLVGESDSTYLKFSVFKRRIDVKTTNLIEEVNALYADSIRPFNRIEENGKSFYSIYIDPISNDQYVDIDRAIPDSVYNRKIPIGMVVFNPKENCNELFVISYNEIYLIKLLKLTTYTHDTKKARNNNFKFKGKELEYRLVEINRLYELLIGGEF